jgi:hypothetical protein
MWARGRENPGTPGLKTTNLRRSATQVQRLGDDNSGPPVLGYATPAGRYFLRFFLTFQSSVAGVPSTFPA